jgi:gluconolactonase
MRILIPMLFAAAGLLAQDFTALHVERAATGYQFTEGPVWAREGYLLFSDIPVSKLFRLTSQGATVFRENTSGTNGNTFDTRGRLYSCEGGARRVTRTDRRGRIEVLADKWQGKRFNAPNDIVVRHDGQIYFTDPAFGDAMDTRELDFYGVYHLTPKGELELVAKPKGRPNGLALAPDGKTLYVDNSDERNVRAYDLDRGGHASNERVIISGIEGVPDGMKVDSRGNLYITAQSVFVYTPEGKLLGKIEIPETPANCAFGDADFQTLYVTARTSVYRVQLNVKGDIQY